MIRDASDDGIVEITIGETDDAGGKGEQVEQADHRQHGKHAEDIGLRLRPPERHQPDGDGHECRRHQEHQRDAARALWRLIRRNRLV